MYAASTTTPTAKDLNDYLAADKDHVIQIGTHTKNWIYKSRHAGIFEDGKPGTVYVRRGKTRDCIIEGGRVLVALRRGRYTKKS